jgi:hypothetical protein
MGGWWMIFGIDLVELHRPFRSELRFLQDDESALALHNCGKVYPTCRSIVLGRQFLTTKSS